jgi:hypothetical protein
MAHFARVENSRVGEVIVVANTDCNDLPFPESELVGQAYIASIGLEGTWLQTSYSGAFRNIFAGQGFIYDEESDTFVVPEIPEP